MRGFDNQRWQATSFELVIEGNVKKFEQNPPLRDFLLSTGDRVLVEASPVDSVWGIGLAADDPRAGNPEQWEGSNLRGFALMAVRCRLAETNENH
ncbi:NADAR family protein [Caballeronia glebae]